jgi:hypothetical protein
VPGNQGVVCIRASSVNDANNCGGPARRQRAINDNQIPPDSRRTGRKTYSARLAAWVDARKRPIQGPGQAQQARPRAFILNLKRRHMTAGQQNAMIYLEPEKVSAEKEQKL